MWKLLQAFFTLNYNFQRTQRTIISINKYLVQFIQFLYIIFSIIWVTNWLEYLHYDYVHTKKEGYNLKIMCILKLNRVLLLINSVLPVSTMGLCAPAEIILSLVSLEPGVMNVTTTPEHSGSGSSSSGKPVQLHVGKTRSPKFLTSKRATCTLHYKSFLWL